MDAGVEKVPCSSTTGGRSEWQAGLFTPVRCTSGSGICVGSEVRALVGAVTGMLGNAVDDGVGDGADVGASVGKNVGTDDGAEVGGAMETESDVEGVGAEGALAGGVAVEEEVVDDDTAADCGSVGANIDGPAVGGPPIMDEGSAAGEPVEQATSTDTARTSPAGANGRRVGGAARRKPRRSLEALTIRARRMPRVRPPEDPGQVLSSPPSRLQARPSRMRLSKGVVPCHLGDPREVGVC